MNLYKHLSMAGVIAAAMFAGQAFAVPVNVSGSNGEDTLQDVLDGVTQCSTPPCHSSIDVNNDQVSPSSYWSVGGTGISASQMVIEITANSGVNSFGIFDAANPNTQYELYANNDGAGSRVTFGFNKGTFEIFRDNVDTGVQFEDNLFGFYLDTPNGIFFSDPSLNDDGEVHMVGFQGNNSDKIELPSTTAGPWLSNEYIFGWEDSLAPGWDWDYNDFVVMAESIHPVPEPAELAILAFGLVLIGSAVGVRRRRSDLS